jgi:hypothetical protein
MSTDLPSDVAVVEIEGGARYVLPRPTFSLTRMIGRALALFGLAPMAMGVVFICFTLKHFAGPRDPLDVGAVIGLVCPSSFILIGGLLSLFGVWLLAGHSEIVVTADEISSAFRLGPLAWRGRRQRRTVRRLAIERLSRAPGPGNDFASLYAETDSGRPLLLALFYPHDWLTCLGADIAGRCAAGSDPMPVVERDAGRASSRSWRRDRPAAAGKKPVPSCFLVIWGLGFLGGGLLCFIFILQALVRGDPGNALEGGYPWKYLWILFPFPFIIPGAIALVYCYRRRGTAGMSPEQLKAVEAAPARRDQAGAIASPAEVEYPTVPSVSYVPGTELAARLTPELAAGCGVTMLLVVVLVCSGTITSLAAYAIGQVGKHQWDAAGIAGFFVLFLGVLWVVVTGIFIKDWRLWRLGHPVVEVSAVPLYCGEEAGLHVTLPGPARLRRLRIVVLCEEVASYTEGTTTRKETRRVQEAELARQEEVSIERWAPFRLRTSFRVPLGTMHSFKAEHNEVRWLVRVEGEAERLIPLKFTYDYPLPVLPPRGAGGKR